jgi:DNA-binding response OmpR family regulator
MPSGAYRSALNSGSIANVIDKEWTCSIRRAKIDQGQWQLTWRAQSIPLNRKTFDLLLFLIDHRERVISKKS